MAVNEFEQKTRSVFDPIHQAQGEDPYIFNRLASLLTTEYLKVSPDWFRGKICLDAGCGSNANATYSMLSLGAARVCAMDLAPREGSTILETVPKFLDGFEGRYELRLGSVLEMEFEDGLFDFSHCAGVLHHTRDVYQGLQELARVTKDGGTLYLQINGKGGLVREFINFLRDKYSRELEFRALIDGLDEGYFAEVGQWLVQEMEDHGDDLGRSIPPALMAQLFDRDLVLTIKDRITAPVYHECSEEEIVTWLNEHGFVSIERLSRYPSYQNVRRFLSPFYYRYDHPVARLLYGSGAIQLKALKPPKQA